LLRRVRFQVKPARGGRRGEAERRVDQSACAMMIFALLQ
jgi:hypothetical protein